MTSTARPPAAQQAGTTPDRVRVLWLIKGLGPGGAERLLVSAARVRDRAGFDYEAGYLLPWKRHLVGELQAQGVRVHCLDSTGAHDLAWALRLRRLLAERRFQVVHCHSPYVAGVARLVVRSLPAASRPRTLTTEHTLWSSYAPATRWLHRATFGLDAAAFAVSMPVRASLPAGLRAGVRVLTHGLVVDEVRTRLQDRAEARTELGIDHDEVLVATVANYRAAKGYPDLLEAARLVTAREPKIRFAAVGQGPDEQTIAARHRELGLAERFVLLGYRPDALRIVAACDIFVLASRHEGLPVALMEALTLGRPVVATAVGGVPGAVSDGVEGRLVAPARPDLLAEAIVALARDPACRQRMSVAAARRGREFDISAAVRDIEAVYRDLAGR